MADILLISFLENDSFKMYVIDYMHYSIWHGDYIT